MGGRRGPLFRVFVCLCGGRNATLVVDRGVWKTRVDWKLTGMKVGKGLKTIGLNECAFVRRMGDYGKRMEVIEVDEGRTNNGDWWCDGGWRCSQREGEACRRRGREWKSTEPEQEQSQTHRRHTRDYGSGSWEIATLTMLPCSSQAPRDDRPSPGRPAAGLAEMGRKEGSPDIQAKQARQAQTTPGESHHRQP